MSYNEPAKQIKLGIAKVVIQFIADDGLGLVVSDTHRRFLVSEGEADLSLRVHLGELPELGLEEILFDSGGVWTLYRTNGFYEVTLNSDIFGPLPYEVAVIDPEFSSGDLYVRPVIDPRWSGQLPTLIGNGEQFCIDPTGYPLDEVLIVNLLSRGKGVELHACGVVLDDKGLLFTGVSGAGKSTLANLWKGRKDALILSDDRVIVRRIDSRLRMFGTPWHGDAETSSPEGAPLEKIFLIKHSRENYASPLKANEAAAGLLVRCFPTYWDQSGMLYTLGLLGDIAKQVPCYELGFVPDESVLDFVSRVGPGKVSY